MLKRKSKSALHRAAIHRAALVEPLERRILLSGTITAVQGQNFSVGDLDGEGTIGPYVYYPYSGTIQIPAGASVSATQVRADGLTVSGNLSMTFAGAGIMDTSHVSVLNWLSMPTDNNGNYLGTLDLSNNALIIRANGNTYAQQAAILAPIEAAIAHAYGTTSPHWTGTGITTTATDTYSGTTAANVAIADFVNNTTQSDTGSPTPILNQLGNVPLALNDIVLAFTVVGDANLSGTVNYTDMQLLMAHYNSTTGMTWYQGDFNYTGSVNFTDYQLLSSNYNFHLPVSTAPQVGLTPPAFVDQFSTLVPPDSLSATVDFGDGSAPTPAAIFDDGSGSFSVFADHTYDQGGIFSDGDTQVSATGESSLVANDNLTADVSWTPASELSANYVSATEVDLEWTDNSGGNEVYTVDERTDSTGWTPIATTPAGATFYAAPGPFDSSSSYYFQIVNTDNSSAVSNPAFASANNIVADGGFEYTPVAAGSDQAQPPSPLWNFAGNSGIESNDASIGAPAAPDGSQAAFIQSDGGSGNGDGSISQTVDFDSGTYTINLEAAESSESVGTPAEPINITVGGDVIETFTPSSPTFTQYSATFTVVDAGPPDHCHRRSRLFAKSDHVHR